MKQMKKRNDIKPGDGVRIVKIPALIGMPAETISLFKACLGRSFPVTAIGPYEHLEIEIARDFQNGFSGRTDSIWVEPDCVEKLGR
jgi:hypothetical protein